LGATASYWTPRTVFGGSVVKNGYGSHPEEVYVCPRAFDGDYTLRVVVIYTDPNKPVTRLTLQVITHEGTAQEQKKKYDLVPDKPDKPIVVRMAGGRRKTVLPYVDADAAFLKAAARPGKRPKPEAGQKASTTNPAPSARH
jgi:hypothetical protein